MLNEKTPLFLYLNGFLKNAENDFQKNFIWIYFQNLDFFRQLPHIQPGTVFFLRPVVMVEHSIIAQI